MRKPIAAFVLALALIYGCSSSSKNTSSSRVYDGGSSAMTVEEAQQLDHIGTTVDSAAALFDFGDVTEFLSVRDSLRMKLAAFAEQNPALLEDPEFARILGSLDGLDSLDIIQNYPTSEMSTMDSLALASDAWPEVDSTEVIGTFTVDDSVFPMLSNDRIDFWIRYFTGTGRERFARTLYRMELYRPVVEEILDEKNMPSELICVALIESGFVMKARSYAAAVGPWQFIPGTARIYGLRVNWWYDERRDIIASTYAAMNYLEDLYGIWESWPLALAAYNCGEYRVARAVARHKTQDFWSLRLPKQTERYVPKFLATLYILSDPAKYGFEIPQVEPVKFDIVTIEDATDIELVAKSAGTTTDVVRDLNPALLRWSTPPGMVVEIKVPVGTGETCEQALDAIPPGERVTWRKHKIRQGESLSSIAGQYGTSVSALKELNGVRNAHRIRAGKYLIVPVQGPVTEVASSKPQYKTTHRTIDRSAIEKYAKKYEPPSGHQRVVYRVKDGDTLGEIAETYRTRASRIRAWNNLSYRSYIYPGQKLVIYVPSSFDAASVSNNGKPDPSKYSRQEYTVRKGDTIYGISKKYEVSMSEILAWNDKSTRSKIYPGQKLEIWTRR